MKVDKGYLLLAVSIVFEIVATVSLKLSQGFTVLEPSIVVVVGYVVSFGVFVVVLKTVPLGVAYGIWGGTGTVATTILGHFLFGDPFSLFTALGVALAIGGIVLIAQGEQDAEEARKRAEGAEAHSE